jgi:hypothetical protein
VKILPEDPVLVEPLGVAWPMPTWRLHAFQSLSVIVLKKHRAMEHLSASPTSDEQGNRNMSDDVTGKDEVITAQAIALAATHWDTYKPPEQLLEAARAEPLALYIAIKYLQSLPEEDDVRVNEHAMKAVLLGRYPYFVKEALASDCSPPDLVLFSHQEITSSGQRGV